MKFSKNPRRIWGLLGMAIGGLILFWPILPAMSSAWMDDPESSHCFLIPLLSAYLLWKSKHDWSEGEWKESWLGLSLLMGGLLLYSLSYVGGIVFAQRFAFVTVINGLVLYNLGTSIYRKILFPMLFLYLMIPIPITLLGLVSFPLQLFATSLSKSVLLNIGIPVIQSGNILHTPAGALEIVQACSGIRSFVSFFTISLFLAHWSRGRWISRTILILSTVPIALGANVLRISFTALIGVIYGMKYARGFLHDLSGFLLFSLGLVVFLLEDYFLRQYFVKSVLKSEGV